MPARAAAPCTPRPVTIDGTSLDPMVKNGAVVAMRPASCAGDVTAGDLVIFKTGAHDKPVIKVVRGTAGQYFAITDDGGLSVNGLLLRNSAGDAYRFNPSQLSMFALYHASYGGVIPPQTYLVLGDDIHGGLDSSRIGFIHRDDIVMVR